MQIKDLGTEKTVPSDSDLIPIQQADGVTRHISKINLLTGISSSISTQAYPISFSHWHEESIIVSGNPLIYDLNANYPYFTIKYQPGSVVGNAFKFSVLLASGTYNVTFIGTQYTNTGIVSIALNDTLQHSDIDFYGNAGIAERTRKIIVPSDGLQTFTIAIVGKNPSSSNYFVGLTKIWGVKT